MSKKSFLIMTLVFLSISLNADTLQRLSAIATGGIPWDNEAIDIYDYLADRTALAIIDISDSTIPIMTFRTNGSLMWSVGVEVVDTLVYVNSFSDLWIGRLYSPDSIHFISLTDLPIYSGIDPWGIQVIDTILFFANNTAGLFILNIKNLTNPVIITSYNTSGEVTEFYILDSLIYLADCDSMIILNIKNPALPVHVGAVDIPTYCTDVHVVYPYAYATAYSSFGVGTDGSVKIIDISNPVSPTIIGSINNIRGDPRAVFVNDDYIYTAAMDFWYVKENTGKTRADIEGGIRVAQGVTPDSLIISYDTPGDPREVFVRGNLILVPDYDSLKILYHSKTGIEDQSSKVIPLISKFIVFPNPVREKITCEFQFQKTSIIILNVYDELGRKVREIYRGPMIAGNVHFYWDGKDQNRNTVSSGEYFVKIATQDGTFSESKKVVYLGGE